LTYNPKFAILILIKRRFLSIQLNSVNSEEVDGTFPRFGLFEEDDKSSQMMKRLLKARELVLPDGDTSTLEEQGEIDDRSKRFL